MTRRRTLHRPVRLFSAILLLATFADEAASQPRDCAALRAIANIDGRDFADLRLRMNAQTGISVGVDAGGGDWLNGTCEMEAGDGEANLSCQWDFSNLAAAAAFHDALLERLRRCLPSGFPRETEASTVPNWRMIRSNQAEFVRGGAETDVELALVEVSTQTPAAPGRVFVVHHVLLTVLGDIEEPRDDEEADEGEEDEDEDEEN